jgi:hypothetical protein
MVLSDDGGRGWEPCNEGLTDMDVHEILASSNIAAWSFSPAAKPASAAPIAMAIGKISRRNSTTTASRWPKTRRRHLCRRRARAAESVAPRRRRQIGDPAQRRQGDDLETVVDNLNGGVMHLCETPDGNGMVAGTSDGTLLLVDDSGVRTVASGLPFVTSVELGA